MLLTFCWHLNDIRVDTMLNILKSCSESIFKSPKIMQPQSKHSSNLALTNSPFLPTIPEPELPFSDHNDHQEIQPEGQWTDIENKLFIIFWIQKILTCSYDIFSAVQPLCRQGLFKEISAFLTNQEYEKGVVINKDDKQCKTKFGTIRKHILRMKKSQQGKKQSKPKSYDFINYILEQGQKIVNKTGDSLLEKLLKQLIQRTETESELMAVTTELSNFKISEHESLNEDILKYREKQANKSKGKTKEYSKRQEP